MGALAVLCGGVGSCAGRVGGACVTMSLKSISGAKSIKGAIRGVLGFDGVCGLGEVTAAGGGGFRSGASSCPCSFRI
jgi:hypothetical protein